MDIKDTIISIISEACEDIDRSEIRDDSKLMDDLSLSSLEMFSVLAELEAEFHISISEEDLSDFIFVEDVVRYISEKTA